jgi:hypothetical protein
MQDVEREHAKYRERTFKSFSGRIQELEREHARAGDKKARSRQNQR